MTDPVTVQTGKSKRLRGDGNHRRVEVANMIRASSSRLSYTTIRRIVADQYHPGSRGVRDESVAGLSLFQQVNGCLRRQ
jgi:hypothetical protein